MAWAGSWGGFDDGRTKLSTLARQIEREYRGEYLADSPLARRRLRQAARYAAIAEMTLATVGVDKKSTRRGAVAAQAAADRLLAQLRAAGAQRQPVDGLAGALAQLHQTARAR